MQRLLCAVFNTSVRQQSVFGCPLWLREAIRCGWPSLPCPAHWGLADFGGNKRGGGPVSCEGEYADNELPHRVLPSQHGRGVSGVGVGRPLIKHPWWPCVQRLLGAGFTPGCFPLG